MKTIKLLLTACIAVFLLNSCRNRDIDHSIRLNELLSSYDLWYVDIQKSEGIAEVSFLQRAFTVSFFNGKMYGNNNIVDIGITGDGFGIEIGNYGTYDSVLNTSYRNGNSDFEVVQISDNEIRLDDIDQNVSYYLVGYQKENFDYDTLFYDNIEYFLQEFVAWEKEEQIGGSPNPFDTENYIAFTPDNDNTFRSSKDNVGLNVRRIIWDYTGDYQISDYIDEADVKQLTMFYDNNDTEEFDLFVEDDERILLKHLGSNTEYRFKGIGFIKYLRGGSSTKLKVNRNNGRKRRKVKRKQIKR